MVTSHANSVLDFFANQTVFLTGSTGGLGGCILYKLAVNLKVAKIFVLVRHSVETAQRKWKDSLEDKEGDLWETGQVIPLVGDCTRPQLGLSAKDLALLQNVSIIINASANINIHDPLDQLVASNCMSALEVAKLGMTMPRLQRFVHVSTAYVNSFLEDGLVEEKLYPFGNPQSEFRQLPKGQPPTTATYHAWSYGYSKHLAEQLLDKWFPDLPLLLVRPSSIGPALEVPYPQYMPQAACPLSNMYARLMYPTEGINIWHIPEGAISGSNILDEIPVDVVANMMLQHIHRGTKGIVHACSRLYIPRTLDDYFADLEDHVPEEWKKKMAKNVFTTDTTQKQCKIANFYKVGTRNWVFDTSRSAGLDLTGPLGLSLQGHDRHAYVRDRLRKIMGKLPIRFRKAEGKRALSIRSRL
ncbi:NAD-binding domain 4 protein [Apiospora marii]|uniref:Fatty acyl-CoA reductase n=1 Tax=Apiospora marii TaxID=335849 RepID=A0ABR1SQJ7_9PEZI